ncbi:MAG: DNA-3-methyladenine glycosylase family protein [Candidatus Puniceispirillaceae bacterium]
MLKSALDSLADKDRDIRSALAVCGYPQDRSMPQGYESLARIIIGQQISRILATNIWQRLEARKWTSAEVIAELPLEDLQKTGLSLRKAEYLSGLAKAVLSGDLDLPGLAHCDGEIVRSRLVEYRGVGNWTADNYRLFALQDMDAWPGNDLALQEAMRRLKSLPARPSAKEMDKLASDWVPYRGAGALFLWHLYAIEVRNATPSDI